MEETPRQMSLFGCGAPRLPDNFNPVRRTDLGNQSWIDFAPNWLPGADAWFHQITTDLKWSTASRPMYDRVVDVPRLIVSFKRSSDAVPSPLLRLAGRFDQYYDRFFTSIGCNWYRDGRDSVAMHRDRIKRPSDSIIAIVSVGERRSFLLKPDDGGPTKKFNLGHGDLLVMGGATQKYWQHAVPKAASAGPRICMMFRS